MAADAPEPGHHRFTSRSATYIGTFTFVARIVERLGAFGQIAVIASLYGSSFLADRYFIASIVPLIFGAIAAEALSANILPALVRSARPPAALVSGGFWVAALVLVILSLGYVAVAAAIVRSAAPTGSNDPAVWYAFAPIGALMGLSGFLGGVLTFAERYVWPPFRSAVASVGGFILMLLVAVWTDSLLWVAIAVTLGYALSFVSLLFEVRRTLGAGALALPARGAVGDAISLGRGLVSPILGGLLGGQVFVLVERVLASTLGVGAVATLAYARGVAFTPVIIAQSIAVGVYPGMIRAYEARDLDHVRGSIVRGLRLTLFMGCTIGAFLLLFGSETIDVLLRRGALNAAAADRSGTLLAAFSLALFGNMLLVLLGRIFYAVAYFRAVVWTQVWALVVYLALALPLRSAWGTTGLAVDFGIAETSAALYGIVLAARHTGFRPDVALRTAGIPAFLRAVPVGIALLGARLVGDAGAVGSSPLAHVALGLVVGLGVAAWLLWTSRWPEVGPLKRRLSAMQASRPTA